MTPLVFAILKARTPREIATTHDRRARRAVAHGADRSRRHDGRDLHGAPRLPDRGRYRRARRAGGHGRASSLHAAGRSRLQHADAVVVGDAEGAWETGRRRRRRRPPAAALSLEAGRGRRAGLRPQHLRAAGAMRRSRWSRPAAAAASPATSARSTPSTAPIARSAIPPTSSPKCARCRARRHGVLRRRQSLLAPRCLRAR